MLFARDSLSVATTTAPLGVSWAERRAAQLSALALRSALAHFGGLPAEAGSRPGGRVPFLCRQERNQRSGPRFNAARFAHGALCCSKHRVAAELALATLGAQTVLATAMLRMSEPDASALLGVSEGEGNASTFPRCPILVAWMQAEGRSPGCAFEDLDVPVPDFAALHPGYEPHAIVAQPTVLTFGSRRERRVAECDREEGRGLSEHRAQRGRVPQAPGRASNAGKSGAQHLTANAGSPFLGYFFWRSKRSNTPAGGGTPANERLIVTSGRHSRWASTNAAQPTKTLARRNAHQRPNRHRRP